MSTLKILTCFEKANFELDSGASQKDLFKSTWTKAKRIFVFCKMVKVLSSPLQIVPSAGRSAAWLGLNLCFFLSLVHFLGKQEQISRADLVKMGSLHQRYKFCCRAKKVAEQPWVKGGWESREERRERGFAHGFSKVVGNGMQPTTHK